MYANKIDAERAGKHIAGLLKATNNRLAATVLLADARKADSPLHTAFEWDDEKAATAYRIIQARDLVSSLKIRVIQEEADGTRIVNVISLKAEEMGPEIIFVPIIRDQNSSDILVTVPPASRLERALWEMCLFKKKYQDIIEVYPIMVALDCVLQQIKEKKAA